MNFKDHPKVDFHWVDYSDETRLTVEVTDDVSTHTVVLNEDGKVVEESNVPHGSRVTTLNLADLKNVLDKYFCAPFLEEGMVKTEIKSYKGEAVLAIQIGRRDVTITKEGKVLHAGTMLCKWHP
jgi:hypothetical protein